MKKELKPDRSKELVDELGKIEEQIALAGLGQLQKRAEEIKREIRSWLDGRPADAGATFEGATYVVVVSAKRMERVVDVVKAFAALGKAKFLACCSLSATRVQQVATLEEASALIAEDRTGSRTVSVARRFQGAVNKRAA